MMTKVGEAACLFILLGAMAPQEEESRRIQELGSDSVEVREEAARALIELGPGAIERLQKAASAAPDGEVKGRLSGIVQTLRKRAEFAKVFGPTRRVTLKRVNRPTGEVLRDLGSALGETLDGGALDLARPITLSLRDASLWEAIEALGRETQAVVEFDSGTEGLVLRPRTLPPLPSLCLEQFRLNVAELQRIDYRGPRLRESVILGTIELQHQRNMHPLGYVATPRIQIDRIADSQGKDCQTPWPEWGGSLGVYGQPFTFLETFHVKSDAQGPLTITGKGQVSFALDVKEVSVPLGAEASQFREGPILLKVSSLIQTKVASSLSVDATTDDNIDVTGRLIDDEATVIDGDGTKHKTGIRSSGGSVGSWSWWFDYPPALKAPLKLVFQWARELKTVEIPFRLEGIPLPAP